MMLHLQGFAKSVAIGTLVVSIIPMLITSFPAVSLILGGEVLPGLTVLFAPILVATPVIFMVSATLGTALTLSLIRLGKESAAAYLCTSAILGAVTMYCITAWTEETWFYVNIPLMLLGALGGAVTGTSWWGTTRQRIAPKKLTAMMDIS